MQTDILRKLNRLLAITAEGHYAVPPVPRADIVAAVCEIRSLRQRVAELESDANDLAAVVATLTAAGRAE